MDELVESIYFLSSLLSQTIDKTCEVKCIDYFIAFGTILSPIVALFIALVNTRHYRYESRKKRLDDLFNQIMILSIQDPELENLKSGEYSSTDHLYEKIEKQSKFINLVFYFLNELFEFYSGNLNKMKLYTDCNHFIHIYHLQWINNYKYFKSRYSFKFVKFIDDEISKIVQE